MLSAIFAKFFACFGWSDFRWCFVDIIPVFLDSFLRHFEHDKKHGFLIVLVGVMYLSHKIHTTPPRLNSSHSCLWFQKQRGNCNVGRIPIFRPFFFSLVPSRAWCALAHWVGTWVILNTAKRENQEQVIVTFDWTHLGPHRWLKDAFKLDFASLFVAYYKGPCLSFKDPFSKEWPSHSGEDWLDNHIRGVEIRTWP